MRPKFDVPKLLDPPEWRNGSRAHHNGRPCRTGDRRVRSPRVAQIAADRRAPETVEVLGLICAGLSIAQIAEGLGVSTGTVTTQITRSLRLGHAGSDELVERARAVLKAG
jgi:DNA-binding NarL/FixJ family response regulator